MAYSNATTSLQQVIYERCSQLLAAVLPQYDGAATLLCCRQCCRGAELAASLCCGLKVCRPTGLASVLQAARSAFWTRSAGHPSACLRLHEALIHLHRQSTLEPRLGLQCKAQEAA